MLCPKLVPREALTAEMQATVDEELNIVLKPISHPGLGDIRIEDNLFAIGRTEPPFAAFAHDVVAQLSRRHARIFSEGGAVYIADLDSKNGTTVNGVNVREKPHSVRHGDEICFGGGLSYRVQLGARTTTLRGAPRCLSVTLAPERSDLGLQPIVVSHFPFLISKADETFSRYRDEYPHQVNYVSRRHAHIFLKGGLPFVEDLGSTNGTFVSGKRLEEHAVPLQDGDSLAFGGNHFVYKVSVEKEPEIDPTVTMLSPAVRSPVHGSFDVDKTTFVAAADSFLDIFCIDHALQLDDKVNVEALQQSDDTKAATERPRERGKVATLLSELVEAFAGSERTSMQRAFWWGTSLAVLLVIFALVLYLRAGPEQQSKDLLASGEYARAMTEANQYLERHPDDTEVMALGSEALLKAKVPEWLTMLKTRQFDRATAALASARELSIHNADAQSLVSELEWIGNLEKFVVGRGGVDAPIRIFADEEKIKGLLKHWDEDTKGHQKALARISSYVPEFKDPYAEALSHLRKLQSDDSVYVAAIERLKTTISTELNRDHPEALEAVLKDYSEKYPRLDGVEAVHRDLRSYMAIESEASARRLGPLVALLAKAQFSTPPFQAQFRTLTSSRLPSADIVRQYEDVSKAWRQGDAKQALSGLQKMASGPWADVVSRQLEHKKAVMEQFADLQKARGTKGYDERLLSFYGLLDPDEDVYFLRATEADVGVYKDKALKRAQELLNQAQALWRQYRENGAIGGEQRLEAGISTKFRTQARLLSEAREDAQRGIQIYTQMKLDQSAQWSKVQDEINAEVELQRRSLRELRMVLEPGLLNAKLALIGERSGEERKSP